MAWDRAHGGQYLKPVRIVDLYLSEIHGRAPESQPNPPMRRTPGTGVTVPHQKTNTRTKPKIFYVFFQRFTTGKPRFSNYSNISVQFIKTDNQGVDFWAQGPSICINNSKSCNRVLFVMYIVPGGGGVVVSFINSTSRTPGAKPVLACLHVLRTGQESGEGICHHKGRAR